MLMLASFESKTNFPELLSSSVFPVMPWSAAFAKLPAGTLESLLKPENKAKLQRILTYHVVAGKAMAADVVKMHTAKAVSGDTISITTNGGTVTVDNAKVVKTDIVASNGVIHVIDSVIVPKDK